MAQSHVIFLTGATDMSAETNSQSYIVSDRNLALELVRVTEAAAVASAHWTGRA